MVVRGVIFSLAVVLTNMGIRAEPAIQVKYAYYQVEGSDAQKVEHDIRTGSSLDHLDGELPGSTWLVKWSYDYEKKNHTCSLSGVSTRVEISRNRPIWKKAANLDSDKRKLWDDYLVHLELSEEAQQDVVMQAANEIENAILKLKPQKSCKELGEAANMIGQGVLAKYRGLEVSNDVKHRLAAYDKRSMN